MTDSNSFVINPINSNNDNMYELRAKDNSISFSFKYIVEVTAARDNTLLGFHTDAGSMVSVERRVIDETDEYINELLI